MACFGSAYHVTMHLQGIGGGRDDCGGDWWRHAESEMIAGGIGDTPPLSVRFSRMPPWPSTFSEFMRSFVTLISSASSSSSVMVK